MKKTEHIFPFLWVKGEDKSLIKEEIDAIYNAGLRAFCVESRIHPDFCGERWFNDVAYILSEAKKRDMQVWILDDKTYPTGIANNIIKTKYPNLRSWRVFVRFLDVAGRVRGAKIPVLLKKEENEELFGAYLLPRRGGKAAYSSLRDVTNLISDGVLYLDIPVGEYRIYFLGKSQAYAERENYIDVMNAESAAKLIEAVYQPHFERFEEFFGNTLVGFFSDEPRLCNWINERTLFHSPAAFCTLGLEGLTYPYSEEVEKEAGITDKKEWLLLWLQAKQTADFRCRYMNAVTKTYSRNFNQALSAWCHQHGVMYCGHIIEDSGAHLRTMCSTGHYFRAMEGADFSGVDVVSHQIKPYALKERHFAPISGGYAYPSFFQFTLAKLASSCANLDPYKRGRALCETFGAYGWGESTQEMAYIANHLLSRGINYFIPHAFSMSEQDNDCPPHFYARGKNPAYSGYKILFKYMNKLAELFSGGKSFSDVAVLYHDEAEWSGKKYLPCDSLAQVLTESQIDFDIVYSDHLKAFERTKEGVSCKGRTYQYILIPACEYLTAETLSLLSSYQDRVIFVDKKPKEAVGKICLKKELTKLLYENGVRKKTVDKADGLRIYEYEKDGKAYALLFNEAGESVRFILNDKKSIYAYDELAGRAYCFAAGEEISLRAGQALLVNSETKEEPFRLGAQSKICEAEIYIKDTTASSFTYYKKSKLPFDINDKEELTRFCGDIRYDVEVDFDKTDVLYVEYSGEYLKIDGAELFDESIGGRRYLDVRNLKGKQKISFTTANTLSYIDENGYTRYSYRPAACIFEIVSYQNEKK